MDADRFDSLTRSLFTAGTRRRALVAALGGSLGLLGLAQSDDAWAKSGKCKPKCGECEKCKKGDCKKTKHGKVCKKGKCKAKANGILCTVGSCQGGVCTAPAPTCSDSVKNGSETGVDCGGACPRCGNGQGCLVANDCISGTCTSSVCVTCTPTQLCGSDSRGSCRCDNPFPSGDPVCDTGPQSGLTVTDCAMCPLGTETCVTINGLLFNCYKRCGTP